MCAGPKHTQSNFASAAGAWLDTISKILASLVLTLGVTTVFGCSDVRGKPRPTSAPTRQISPNILLITLDTTRADHLGSYGYGLARTPRLDALAREGVRATRVTAVAPITATAHASMLTGLLPPAHGVRDNGSFRLPDEVATLPELLRERGYRTAAFVSAAVLESRYNLSQGFEHYDDDLWAENAPEMFMIRERAGARTATRAIDWIAQHEREHSTQPFFVWVHFFDVHEPHTPKASEAVLSASPYDAEIAGVDRQVGAVVDAALGGDENRNVLIAVTADHGESLGEHGETTHGIFVYESTTHIPLLMRWPGRLPAGRVYDGPVSQVDLFPTLLAASGAPLPETQGVNLLDALVGTAKPVDHAVYSESKLSELGFGMAPLHALRDGQYTYVRAPQPELYDRASDPDEAHNILAREPAIAARLSAALDRVLRDSERRAVRTSPVLRDPQNTEVLRALGYVGDGATRKEVAAMDPKAGIAVYEKLHAGRHLVRRGQHREAGVVLRELLALTPRNVSALNVLALSEAQSQRGDAALAHYRESLGIEPNQPSIHLAIANILLARRDYDAAFEHAREVNRLSPDFIEGLVALGVIEYKRGHKDRADAYYTQALSIDPKFPRALHAYADLYYREGDYARALDYYERALERMPGNFEALVAAGGSARRTGDTKAAFEFYRRAELLRPDSFVPAYNAACLHVLQNNRAAALEELRRAVDNTITDPDLLERDPDFAALRSDPEFIALAARAQASARPAQCVTCTSASMR